MIREGAFSAVDKPHPAPRRGQSRLHGAARGRRPASWGVHRKQALESGLSAAAVRTLLRSGTWTVMARGVYAPTAMMNPDPIAHHVLQAAARVLTSELGVVASHRTAALVHGLPLLGRPPVVPQLTRAPRYKGMHPRSAASTSPGFPRQTRPSRAGSP